jgi:prepilin-type N-terminal cleavage/methylation domain-containing protein
MKIISLKTLSQNSGFTLIEVVIAIAIIGVIMVAVNGLISQSVQTSRSNNEDVVAIRNLDVTGNWIIRDLQSTQTLPGSISLLPQSGNMTITQSIEASGDRLVIYSLSANGDLLRTVGTNSSHVAQHISSLDYVAGTASTPSMITVTATVGQATVTRGYDTASRITDFNTVLTIITDTLLPGGDVGVVYSATLSPYGGVAPYSWAIISGSLPGWATFDGASGNIQGNNPTQGNSSFTAQVTDSSGTKASKVFSLTIVPKPHDITPTSFPAGNIGLSYGPVNLSVIDGTTPKLWSLETGTLPTGLDINSSGTIFGTPTAGAVGSTFTVTVTDGVGVSVTSNSLSIMINGPFAVVTNVVSNVAKYTAQLNGTLTGTGSASTVIVSFEYGTTASYGQTVSGVPASLSNPGNFSASISGLTHKTTYHYRAKAVANGNTVYGQDRTFTTDN